MFVMAWPLAELDSLTDFSYFSNYTGGGDGGLTATSPDETGKSFSMGSYWGNGYVPLVLPANQAGKTCRFRVYIKLPATPGVGNVFTVFANPTSGEQVRLYLNGLRKLEVRRGGSILATGTSELIPSVWHDIQSEILVHGSTGTFNVYLDNTPVPEITFTGNTQAQATNDVNCFYFGSSTTGALWDTYYNDPILFNSDGPLYNGLIPPGTKILKLPLSADGASSWPRSGGANNVDMLNDPLGAPNDANYIYSVTPDQLNLSEVTDFTETGDIVAVMLASRINKAQSGARSVLTGIRIGATDLVTERSLPIGPKTYFDVITTSDGISTQLTPANITDMKAVAKVGI